MLQGPAPGVHESPKGTGPTLASAKAASAAASSGGGKGKSTKAAPKDQQDQAAEPAQQPPWCPATLTDVRWVVLKNSLDVHCCVHTHLDGMSNGMPGCCVPAVVCTQSAMSPGPHLPCCSLQVCAGCGASALVA
jgi:hypothetical protein